MIFVPCPEKSIRHATFQLLAVPTYKKTWHYNTFHNDDHFYAEHFLFGKHCYVLPRELKTLKSTVNIVTRLGQHDSVQLAPSITTKLTPGNPNKIRLHPEMLSIPVGTEFTTHGWPKRETENYKICGKLFRDQEVVPAPPSREKEYSS